MDRTLHFIVLVILSLAGNAQTHFYIDQIAVDPSNPTTADNVSIALIGNLSDGGAYVQTAVADVGGGTVNITLVALSNGGITVLVPHTETIVLGQLPAGTYTIDFTDASTGILDGAPPAQHTFTVSGSEFPCAELTVDVQWAFFSDTAVVVHVQNPTVELFDHPNFILFDAQGDTLAKETVTYFGIAQDSWHTLRLMDGVEAPVGAFDGRLELWTGFTSVLACVWEQIFDLCPPSSCTTVHPTLANFGGAQATGTFLYNIWNDQGLIAEGQFVLTNELQTDSDTLCLPPGNYVMDVSPPTPPAGAPVYFIAGQGPNSTEAWPVVWSLPVGLNFMLLPHCVGTPQSIGDGPTPGLRITTVPGGLWVRRADGRPLGALRLMDTQGRLVLTTNGLQDHQYMSVSGPGIYILSADDHAVKIAAGME